MEKLFRFHRGGLKESLATSVSVTGLQDVIELIKSQEPLLYPELSNIRISDEPIEDYRLPEVWGNIEYRIVADYNGYKGQCFGFTNFKE